MEAHLKILQASHGYPDYLSYKNTCIDKPYIRTGKPALHHQLFFPIERLEEWKGKCVGFDYNGRSYNDVKLAATDGKVITIGKGYVFVKDKLSELHTTVRERDGRFETRPFSETPKV